MGYYIQGDGARGKADWLMAHKSALIVPLDEARAVANDPDSKMGVVCVVRNSLFDAACFCYNSDEFESCNNPKDIRPKLWLVMDKAEAARLSGYDRLDVGR